MILSDMKKLDKFDWGKIYDSIVKNVGDVVDSYFIEPKTLKKKDLVWVDRNEFIRMIAARILDDPNTEGL